MQSHLKTNNLNYFKLKSFSTVIVNNLKLMEAFQIPGILGNSICRAKPVKLNEYMITKDSIYIGSIIREDGGWRIKEQVKEDLSAENAQLIGDYINKKR